MKNKSSKRTSLYLVIGLVIVSIVMSIFIQRPKFIEYNEAISTSLNNIYNLSIKKNSALQDYAYYLKELNFMNSNNFKKVTSDLSANSLKINERKATDINQIITNLNDTESQLHLFQPSNTSNSYKKLRDLETNLKALNNRITISLQEYDGSVNEFNRFRSNWVNILPAAILGYDPHIGISTEVHSTEDVQPSEKYSSNEERAAKLYFESVVKSESEGILALSTFNKDNGIKQQFLGMNLYEIEFTAEIIFEEIGYKCVGSEGINWSNFYVSSDSVKACQFHPEGGIYAIYPYEFDKGANIRLTGSVMLEETDNGWRGSSYEIRGYRLNGINPKPANIIEYKTNIHW